MSERAVHHLAVCVCGSLLAWRYVGKINAPLQRGGGRGWGSVCFLGALDCSVVVVMKEIAAVEPKALPGIY